MFTAESWSFLGKYRLLAFSCSQDFKEAADNRNVCAGVESIQNLLKNALGMCGIVTDARRADRGHVPEILVGGLRDGNLEVSASLIQQAPEHRSLTFEGEASVDSQMHFQSGDDHQLSEPLALAEINSGGGRPDKATLRKRNLKAGARCMQVVTV